MQTQTIVGGRYRLGGCLGRGGMAEVRIGLDTHLGRVVAVKRLTAELATDQLARALFESEARAAASLSHPGIVRVFDAGEDRDPRTGVSTPYLVMEFLRGQTLSSLLRQEQKLPPRRALRLIGSVLDALAYSHQMGIVHRDIKPSNLMLAPSSGVKLMDFGIARSLAEVSPSPSLSPALAGTANYLSPEQARGETSDVRSDIYSTGCLLYALLVGRPPFLGPSFHDTVQQHLTEPPARPSSLAPDISDEIDEMVLKALGKDPKDRYQSADEMRTDIRRVLGHQGDDAAVPGIVTQGPRSSRASGGAAAASRVGLGTREHPKAAVRGTGRKLSLVAASLVALLGVSLYDGGGAKLQPAQGQHLGRVAGVAKAAERTAAPPGNERPETGRAEPTAADRARSVEAKADHVPSSRTHAATSPSRNSFSPPPPSGSGRPGADAEPAAGRHREASGSAPHRAPGQRGQFAPRVRPAHTSQPQPAGQPEERGKPSTPEKQNPPKRTTKPGKPQGSLPPSRPSEPDRTSTPNTPSKPQPPDTTAQPEKPTKPSEPPESAKPPRPERPAKPERPVRPEKPAKPEKPEKPEKPAEAPVRGGDPAGSGRRGA